MSPNIRNRRRLALGLAASLGLLASGPGRGDTVDASSTTMLIVRDQARAGGLFTEAPIYELLSVSAREVQNPVADHLSLVVSGWGALSLGDNLVWYDTTPPQYRFFGDLDLAYIQGEVLKRTLKLRLGRQLVTGGVTGSLQLDGADALVRLPYGFGVSAYVGSPVSQRFDARGTEATFNPQRGTFAVGGRAYWTLPRWGEIGFSGVDILDRGDPSRRQLGADARLTPLRPLTILASSAYDLYESRWAEATVGAQVQVNSRLLVSADYRHVEPDLFLPRDSLLAIFSFERRNEAGGSVQYGLCKTLTLLVDYHYQKQVDSGAGHRTIGRATWQPARDTTVGVELGKLRAVQDNGYFNARGFGSQRLDRFTGTLDLQEYAFDHSVNGQGNSFVATGTLGYLIGGGWAALVNGTAAATPYYKSRFDLMAKLTYDQSYRLREVRP
jgi:hypothetical protein